MTKLILVAALLVASMPAHADYIYTAPNGSQIGTSCYKGSYGYQCRTWQTGNIYGERAAPAPIDTTPNTNPNWGKGCKSCDDVSK